MIVVADDLLLCGINLIDAGPECFGDEFVADELFCYYVNKDNRTWATEKGQCGLNCGKEPD